MRKAFTFLLSIGFLALLIGTPNSSSAEPLPQNISPIYNISTTLLYWNGTGYLPVTVAGDGKNFIMATVGYQALITNVTVLSESSNDCTVRVEYIITKAYGVNVPINRTLSKTFVVDAKTNSFILNGTTAFFPFYVCSDGLKYTYHFNEKINVNKTADFVVWRNVTYGGKPVTLEFGPVYSAVGKEVMGYLCSAADLEEKKCVEFEPDPEPILDADFSSHYVVSVYGTYPGDPLGIFKGPMEFVGGIIKSERTAKLVGARPEERNDANSKYILAGVVAAAGVVILVRRVKG